MSESRTPVARRRAARRRSALLAAPAAVASLLAAAPALAEPALPQLPADGAVVGTLRPSFSWTAGSSGVPIARYEILVETPGGVVKAAEAPAGTLSATASVDLPDDGRHRWFVRLVNTLGGVASTPVNLRTAVTVATPPAAPEVVEGPSGTSTSGAPVFSWTGSRAASRWIVADAGGAPVQSGEVAAGGGRAALAPLPDGAYVFRVAQRNLAGAEGEFVSRTFAVDATAPAAPSPTASGTGQPLTTTPAFTWGDDPGTVATWRIRGAGGRIVAGPLDTAQNRVTPGPLPPGAYVFEVRLTDEPGNVGPWGSEPFSLVPGAAARAGEAARPGRARLNLLRRHALRLSPRPGATVATTRPVLRWRGAPAGTRLYNVQLFRLGPANRLVKVGSAFPGGTRFALPKGMALTRGDCFVWRVWPHRDGGYAPVPLGISDFCVSP